MQQPTDQDIDTAFKRAPAPVRAFITAGDWTPIITQIGGTYQLHIDQIGIIAQLNTQMLLGLVSPSQFLGGLLVAGIPEPEAREIMKEINEKIFMPLQEEMRKNPAVAGQEPARPLNAPLGASGARPPVVLAPPPSYGPPAPPRPTLPPPPPVQVRPAPPMPPAPVGQIRTAESDLASAIAHAKEHPPTAAPLPPRGALPGTAARAPGQPIYHHPLPTPPEGPGQRGETPPNLPTGAAPYAGGTSTEEFPSLPPLVKPPTAPLSSTPEDAIPPHTRYPNDPYREPFE